MHIIKGFATINQYINNVPGQTSLLGELSTWSTTYTKEKGIYEDPAVPGYKLITFKSIDDFTREELVLSQSQVSQILEVIKKCVQYATGHIRPYNTEDFRNTILTQFHSRISTINFGEFVDNGHIALPGWISWNSDEHDGAYMRIWTSDLAFSEQYDDFKIEVVPPIANVDDLFGFYSTAISLINARSIAQLSDAILEVKDNQPETYLRMFTYDFINVANPAIKTETNWAVLIYGKAGDNVDTIKDAIIEYLLTHSTHSRSEWTIKFPDIFRRTEFVILPRWDKLSVPNLTVMSSLYASIMDPNECIQFAKDNISFYPNVFIDGNVNIMPYDYKAITLLVVNGTDNIPGKQKLVEVFDDYIPVHTSSPDFNRMKVRTRDWLIVLEELLMIAETATKFTSVPSKIRRTERDGVLYISTLYDNVNYLVAAKSNSFYQD